MGTPLNLCGDGSWLQFLVDALMDGLQQKQQFVENLPAIFGVVNEVGRKVASPTAIGDLKTMIAPPT